MKTSPNEVFFLPSFSAPSLRAAGQKPSISPRWFSIRCVAPSIAWLDIELAPTWHPGRSGIGISQQDFQRTVRVHRFPIFPDGPARCAGRYAGSRIARNLRVT